MVMLLARPQGAEGGTRGVGLFLMPRRLDDGSPNHYRIVRLKDKLGTRSMASGEIKLEGAIAYAVGKLDRGFVQMAEMVNSSRLSNGVKSTALMRRAYHDAMTVARNRVVFGQPHHRPAAGAAAIDEDHARNRAGAVDEFSHRRRARPRRGRQPGRRGAAADPDADPEIPRHPRCAKGVRRRAGDARRHRLHRGIRHRAAVARRASRLDLGRHRQYRRARCAEARGRPPWRRRGAGRRSACPSRRQRRMCRRPGATACAILPTAPSALPARSRGAPTTKPRRGAPPACCIMSPARWRWRGKAAASMRCAAMPAGCCCRGMVIDHRVSAGDPFRLTENAMQRAITGHLLGERAVGMAEVGELLSAA